ncbi:MAG: acyltransferase [Lachnospiraceae bacterium]|nr:acyltransferase [Lachnospiraceae bacterium]
MKKHNSINIEGKERYEIIDFLKGFSIVTIVLMHLLQVYMKSVPDIIRKMALFGGTGVHVFFFCSGFGLFVSWMKKKPSFRDFICYRFVKIYVPYIIVVIISALCPLMYHKPDKFLAVLSHIFLFKMFFPNYEESFGGQFWYLSTLFQFYFIFLLLCRLRKCTNRKRFVLIGIGISAVWWCIVAVLGFQDIRVWNSFFLQYIWEFMFGMAVAEFLQERKSIKISYSVLFVTVILGIGIQSILALKGGAFKLFNDIPALFGYGALGIILYEIFGNVWKKAVFYISKISYEWYLTHILVFTITFHLLHFKNIYGEIMVSISAFLISIIVAVIYGKLVKNYREYILFICKLKDNRYKSKD